MPYLIGIVDELSFLVAGAAPEHKEQADRFVGLRRGYRADRAGDGRLANPGHPTGIRQRYSDSSAQWLRHSDCLAPAELGCQPGGIVAGWGGVASGNPRTLHCCGGRGLPFNDPGVSRRSRRPLAPVPKSSVHARRGRRYQSWTEAIRTPIQEGVYWARESVFRFGRRSGTAVPSVAP